MVMKRLRTPLGAAIPLALGFVFLLGGSENSHAGCQLQSAGGQIKHVVHIVFDNVHLRRDNPNVPSDLEQMPNLLNFILNNGTISGNHHTPLISHTADDIVTGLTGVYGDRQGIPVANSYGFFRADGSVGFSSSFLYWTALSADGKPEMINELGKTAPAPWVPFTRAGCDVGAFSVANIEFESLPADIRTVYGTGSPEDVAVTNALNLPNTPANQPARQAPNTDWLGIAVHCAQGSSICSGSGAKPDLLPDEPGGYVGFSALYGNKNVAPVICQGASTTACDASSNVKDTNGNIITDAYGHPGFPNVFSPTAAQSLGYAATMLEKGIQVVYVYVADAHDRNPLPLDPSTNKPTNAHAFGPGEAEYVAQLKAYDTAFGNFFARLAADGISKDNTLFVVVPDENDHFVGSEPAPVGCNGVTVPCTYSAASEIVAFLDRLLLTQRNNTTPFSVHNDDAPVMYINGNPAPTAAVTRTMEHDLDALVATNPITGATDRLSVFLADQAEMKLLHMITQSPARTPTLTMFGNDNYFFERDVAADANLTCSMPPACVFVPSAPEATFAWNHGDVQREITRTWFGVAGPGVRKLGRFDAVFSDHTDVRPTMLALLGLKDDYVHDGRVLAEWIDTHALPQGIRGGTENFIELAQVYKQLNAPLGLLSRKSLVYANRSITSDDATYGRYLNTIGTVTTERDGLAAKIKTVLNGAAFNNQPVSEGAEDGLGRQANAIIDRVQDLADRGHDDEHSRHFGE
jgi:hypothetical protein